MKTITNLQTGERVPLSDTVCHIHPAWVHEQCGTKSEGELQRMLDCYSTEDYYDENGNHKGPDFEGIEMFKQD